MRRLFPTSALVALATCLAVGLTVLVVGHRSPERWGDIDAGVLATATTDRQIDLTRFDSGAQWRTGKARGLTVTDAGDLAFDTGTGTTTRKGRQYDVARWTSRWTSPGFDFTELIASWAARTPGSSWIEVQVRGRSAERKKTSWDVLARWAAKDKHHRRRSMGAQSDDGTRVAVDTWRTAGLASYKLRVLVHRQVGKKSRPRLDLATVMTSRLPTTAPATSKPGVARGVELDVPRYSQMSHVGHYPQWGSGGEAWCSPTSTSMVLGYYGSLPKPGAYGWVPGGHIDPWVDLAARSTYDHKYDGTGNWPFNTAWAARYAGKAFVTRLRTLREAEQLVKAGIPPVVSIAFDRGELTGTPISRSNGHLLVVTGFTAAGDVIVNDPAASSRSAIRRVYDRAQFEKVWLEASGGTAYVIHDAAHPLPASPGNW